MIIFTTTLRGGGWHYNTGFCRITFRFAYYPEIRNLGFGFRFKYN